MMDPKTAPHFLDPTLDRRTTPARHDLACETLRGKVEATRFVPGVRHRVYAPDAPLRRHPSPDAALDTQALAGEPVTVFEEKDGWSWCQLERDGYVGYLPSAALGAAHPAPTHRIRALRTFVYPKPDIKSPPLYSLSMGAEIAVLPDDAPFLACATGGWIWAAHAVDVATFEADFVTVTKRFSGVPYLWGGKTSLGLDCSGLVQLALRMSGIDAPRDADLQQSALGKDAPLNGPYQRGDIIFWKGHVGVMMNSTTLLHANGYHMQVEVEPLMMVCERIDAQRGGLLLSIKRYDEK